MAAPLSNPQCQPILDIAQKLGLNPQDVIRYGDTKAKIRMEAMESGSAPGKLVLVSAIPPTRAGEGKTTTTIGLGQGLAQLGHSVCLALREPSLGPCLGMKGGATGGGAKSDFTRRGNQPAFHGGFSRRHRRKQSFGRPPRQ